jgi:hypothetical protein
VGLPGKANSIPGLAEHASWWTWQRCKVRAVIAKTNCKERRQPSSEGSEVSAQRQLNGFLGRILECCSSPDNAYATIAMRTSFDEVTSDV